MATHIQHSRLTRLDHANELLHTIGSCGRRFFAHGGEVSHFAYTVGGRLIWCPGGTWRRIASHSLERTQRFHEGHTLRTLVCHLRDYIMHGTPLRRGLFGPWPAWVCGGDLWGYGEDMARVREVAEGLRLMAKTSEGVTV
jgi:hypothetical protein